jgi:hypothetical protein
MASNLFDLIPRPDHVPLQAKSMRMHTPALSTIGPKTERSQLGVDFQPSDFSVICGRSKNNFKHTGNRCFRVLARTFVERYSQADSQAAKAAVVLNIVTIIRQAGGHFCKYEKEKGKWFEVGDRCARGKVSYLLRDMLHPRYRSSSTARRHARAKETGRQTQQFDQQLVDDTEHCDDSSMSSCSGSSTDSLGFDSSQDIDFFDIDVF